MDSNFLHERIKIITNYSANKISIAKERNIYLSYVAKLSLDLKFRARGIKSAISCIQSFHKRELMRINYNPLYRKKLMLELACQNIMDTSLAMQRWDGIDNSELYMENY